MSRYSRSVFIFLLCLLTLGANWPAIAQLQAQAETQTSGDNSGGEGFIRAQATASPQKAAIGDPIRYVIEIEWTGAAQYSDFQVKLPEMAADFYVSDKDEIGAVHVPSGDGADAGKGAGMGAGASAANIKRWSIAYTLRPLRAGTLTIPPVTVNYQTGAKKTETLSTNEASVEVEPLAEGAAKGKLEGLTAPESIEFDWTLRNVLIGVAILAALAGGFLAHRAWKRASERRLASLPPPPPRPAHEVAIEELDALQDSQLLRQGRIKEFYTRLAEILRRYATARFGCPAMDWTSWELLQALERDALAGDAASRELLARVLEDCDMVKFARWSPTEDRGLEGIRQARQFVKATTRTENVPCAG